MAATHVQRDSFKVDLAQADVHAVLLVSTRVRQGKVDVTAVPRVNILVPAGVVVVAVSTAYHAVFVHCVTGTSSCD